MGRLQERRVRGAVRRKITGTQYGVEFTVKYGAFVSGANDRTYRFSVEMGTGASSDLKGMTFDPGNTEDNRVVVNKSPSDLDGGGYEQWNEANFCVHAEGGARMRAVRNGKRLRTIFWRQTANGNKSIRLSCRTIPKQK